MTDLLINPYHKDVVFKNFPNLDTDLKLHYDRIYDSVVDFNISPRFFYETGLKIAFRDIFYYIDMLYDNAPQTVIDVGCGECLWKNWFPNIIGFDTDWSEFSRQDFVGIFDAKFSRENHERWDNGMGLNSLHFINWKNFEQQIHLAMNIVKHRFLFTVNFNMIKGFPFYGASAISEVRQLLEKTGYQIKLFDAPALRGIPFYKVNQWIHINGHVRFILSKTDQ